MRLILTEPFVEPTLYDVFKSRVAASVTEYIGMSPFATGFIILAVMEPPPGV